MLRMYNRTNSCEQKRNNQSFHQKISFSSKDITIFGYVSQEHVTIFFFIYVHVQNLIQ